MMSQLKLLIFSKKLLDYRELALWKELNLAPFIFVKTKIL